jgi:hypothetical protein
MRPRQRVALVAVLGSLSFPPSGNAAPAADPRILTDAPAAPDPAASYLFYIHGRILELGGRNAVSPDFGPYQYDAILQAFATRGFTVISEVRQGEAGMPFVHKVAEEARRLLAAGVPPQRVTLVGASKGGFLTLAAAAEIGEPEVAYVVLAACGPSTLGFAPKLRGRILSIYDSKDRYSPSCDETFKKAPGIGPHREIVLKLGLDHGLLFRPREEWVAPAVEWALRK